MLNVQNQAEIAPQFSRFVGMANLKVVAVNPTAAEIKQLFGRDMEKEPNYWDAATQQRKLVFYLEGDELAVRADKSTAQLKINATHTIFLKNEVEPNKNKDKFVYIDKFGKHLFMSEATSKALPENYKMDQASVRPAFKGEGDLIYFLKALAAPANDQPFFVSNLNTTIVNGDVSVIRQLLATCKQYGNTIRALLGIRTAQDGKKYQTIYRKCIERGTGNSLNWMWKSLKDNQQYNKDYFGSFDFSREHADPTSFILKEYYDGMEGVGAATAIPATAPSFHNAFAQAGAVPAAMGAPAQAAPQGGPNFGNYSNPAADAAFEANAYDDLPF